MVLNAVALKMIVTLISLLRANKDLIFKVADNITDRTTNEIDDGVVEALAAIVGVNLEQKQVEAAADKLGEAQGAYDAKKEAGEKLSPSALLSDELLEDVIE